MSMLCKIIEWLGFVQLLTRASGRCTWHWGFVLLKLVDSILNQIPSNQGYLVHLQTIRAYRFFQHPDMLSVLNIGGRDPTILRLRAMPSAQDEWDWEGIVPVSTLPGQALSRNKCGSKPLSPATIAGLTLGRTDRGNDNNRMWKEDENS